MLERFRAFWSGLFTPLARLLNRLGVSPDVNALATILVLLVTAGVIASALWMRRQEKRREREIQLAIAENL